jgi:hypothetical protein
MRILMLGSAPMATAAALWPTGSRSIWCWRSTMPGGSGRTGTCQSIPTTFPWSARATPGPGQRGGDRDRVCPGAECVWGLCLCWCHDGVHGRLLGACHALRPSRDRRLWLRHALSEVRSDPFLRGRDSRPVACGPDLALSGGEGGAADVAGGAAGLCNGQSVDRPVAAGVSARDAGGRGRGLALCRGCAARRGGPDDRGGAGYEVPSGRYWEEAERFDVAALDRVDAMWLAASALPLRQTG